MPIEMELNLCEKMYQSVKMEKQANIFHATVCLILGI